MLDLRLIKERDSDTIDDNVRELVSGDGGTGPGGVDSATFSPVSEESVDEPLSDSDMDMAAINGNVDVNGAAGGKTATQRQFERALLNRMENGEHAANGNIMLPSTE